MKFWYLSWTFSLSLNDLIFRSFELSNIKIRLENYIQFHYLKQKWENTYVVFLDNQMQYKLGQAQSHLWQVLPHLNST